MCNHCFWQTKGNIHKKAAKTCTLASINKNNNHNYSSETTVLVAANHSNIKCCKIMAN